jgi:iron complex outermembrane recepter protein
MLNRWQYLMFGATVLSALMAMSVRAEVNPQEMVEELDDRQSSLVISELPIVAGHESLDDPEAQMTNDNGQVTNPDLEPPATTVEEWIAQIEQSLIQVTAVQVNATETGVEITLETDEPLEVPGTSVVGNALIADIPNAVLALPEGEEFQQVNPVEEIALVSVTSLPNNRVRVVITGSDAPPTANLSVEPSGLVLAITPGTEAATGEDEDAIQVVVTATRTEEDILNVPRSVTVVEREEIEEQARLNRNLYEILGTTVPGFGPPNQSDRNNAQLLRGREPLVLIDGVPQNSNFYGAIGLRGFDPNIVERIEVVSGPTGLYGSGAAGGVVNIITRRPEEQFTSRAEIGVSADLGNLEGDSFAYDLGYGFSGSEENIDFLFNLGTQFTNQFYDAEGDRIPQDNPTLAGATVINLFGQLGFELGEQQRLQITANYAQDEREVDFISDPIVRAIPGRQTARALEVNQDYINLDEPGNQTASVNLSYSHENLLGSQLQLQAYYWRNEDRAFPFDDRGGFYDAITVFSPFEAEAFGGRLQIETPLFENAELLWGTDYRNERNELILEIIDPVDFDNSGGQIVRSIGERNLLPPYRINQLGLFAQAQIGFGSVQSDSNDPRFILSGGIRQEFVGLDVEDYTTFFGDEVEGGNPNFDATVFNVGGVFRATENISLFASFSQGFSVPLLFSLATAPSGISVDEGFEALEPQQIDNYEIGVRGRWQNLQASLAAFYSYSELGTFFQFNSGDSVGTLTRAPQRNYGIEATLDWQATDRWQLGSAISWNEGEADADNDDEFTALGTFDIQPLKLTAYVEHQTTPTWRNRLQLLYSGSRDSGFEDGADGLPIEDYVTLDLISQLQFGDGTLSLAVENLLDNQYFPVFSQVSSGFDDTGYRAARGRRVSLTYAISW